MLRQKLPGGFVCLRCRLQLSGPTPQRLFSTAAQVRHESHGVAGESSRVANASAYDRAEKFSRIESQPVSTASPKPETGDSLIEALEQFEANKEFMKFEDDNIESKDTRDEIDGENEHGTGRYPTRQRNARYSRGKYTVSGENLPINMLGSPAGVMVVRPRSLPARKNPPEADRDEDPTPEVIELLAQQHIDLKVKKIRPEFSDIMASLDELRPKDAGMLAAEDFVDLRERIAGAFTVGQLKAYLSAATSEIPAANEGQAEPHQTSSYPWIQDLLAWEPLDHVAAQADTPQNYVSESSTVKQKLAVRIMRMNWGLASRGGFEVPGQLKVQIRNPEFKLLTLITKSAVQNIAKAILEPGDRLDVESSTNTVSIVAPRIAAERVMAELESLLSKMSTSCIDVSSISSEPPSSALLKDVGRMTNALVEFDPCDGMVHVSWIDLSGSPEGLETAGDVVRRSLYNALLPRPRTSASLVVVPRKHTMRGRYLPSPGCGPHLPWYERRQQWARWHLPISKQQPRVASFSPIILTSVLPRPIEVKSDKPCEEDAGAFVLASTSRGWSRDPETITRAVFGHVLHSGKSQRSLADLTTVDPLLTRTFIPRIPPLAALNLPTLIKENRGTALLRFIPDPQQPSPSRISLPPLELRFEVDFDKLAFTHITSIRALVNSFVGDILMPCAPVDVRLKQDCYFELQGSDLEEHAPAVLDFINTSDLRPWDGKLGFPPVLKGLELPCWLLTTESGGNNNIDLSPEEKTTVDYLFSSFELQRDISTRYKGFKLSYRSIEAGKSAGMISEMALDAVTVGSEDSSAQAQRDGKGFLRAVSKLAFRVVESEGTFGWQRHAAMKSAFSM